MKGYLFLALFFTSCSISQKSTKQQLPSWMTGQFSDDYGINYTINDTVFIMEGAARYHILQWNEKEQYLLTQNDTTNKTDKGLYTRIDYMSFTGMEPFKWGYCFTVYNAIDTAAALRAAAADRTNPKKGCNGYPFSRMKRRG
jgi:hypothetical protein